MGESHPRSELTQIWSGFAIRKVEELLSVGNISDWYHGHQLMGICGHSLIKRVVGSNSVPSLLKQYKAAGGVKSWRERVLTWTEHQRLALNTRQSRDFCSPV